MAPVFFSTQFMAGNLISNLGSNYFHFEIARLPTVVYNCQEVNLPSLSHSPADQPTTLGIPIKRPIGKYDFADLQLSFIVDENMVNWFEIYTWMRQLGNIDDDCTYNSLPFNKWTTQAKLYITKGTYNDNIIVNFYEVFPTFLGGLKFVSTDQSYSPQYAAVKFAYTYYDFTPQPSETHLR